MKDVKLKNLKYQIQGVDSNKPALECLSAVILGMLIPLLIAIVVRFASEIDSIWIR